MTSIETSNKAIIAGLPEYTHKERIQSRNFLSHTANVKEVNV
jgi:hypothetical protein